jgi:hypothetical protein
MLRNLLSRMRSNPEEEKPEVHHGSRKGEEGTTATGAMLSALLPSCPVCKKNIKDHFFVQVASTIASDSRKSVMASLFGSVRQHEWNRLTEFKEWDALADNLVVYVIKGDHADGTILVVKDVFELYASNDLILLERITDSDIAAISGQFALEWQQVR